MQNTPQTPIERSALNALNAFAHQQIDPAIKSALTQVDLTVSNGRLFAAISVPAEHASAYEPMRVELQKILRNLGGIEAASVILTAEKDPQAEPRRAARKLDIEGVKHIIAVASGKGGVGKSTITANLAIALRNQGLRVGVLDADIYGPSQPILFGLTGQEPELLPPRTLVPLQAYGIKVMSIGFLVNPDAAMIWRGPMVTSALTQLFREVSWGELDVLLLDMPPGTGDIHLTIAQSASLSGAVIVATPQEMALADARRGIAMFKKVSIPILGVVENMSAMICGSCGTKTDVFGAGGARREAEKQDVPFLGAVTLMPALRELSDQGKPLVEALPQHPIAENFMQIAQSIMAYIDSGMQLKSFPRIVYE